MFWFRQPGPTNERTYTETPCGRGVSLRRRAILRCGLAGVIVLTSLSSCRRSAPNAASVSPERAARYIGLTLPDDVANVRYYQEQLFTLVCVFSFDASRQAVDTFLTENSVLPNPEEFGRSDSLAEHMGVFRTSIPWWDLSTSTDATYATRVGYRTVRSKSYQWTSTVALLPLDENHVRVFLVYVEEAGFYNPTTAAQKPIPQRSDRLTATELVAPEPVGAQPASQPAGSSAAERLRELCRAQVELAGLWRYEKHADTQAIVPHADPPWPEDCVDILLELDRPLCKSLHVGLKRMFVPEPEGRQPGGLSPGMVSLQYTTYALTYNPTPPLVKPSAVRFAELFASETGCSSATEEQVTGRIRGATELALSIDGVRVSETIPEGVCSGG